VSLRSTLGLLAVLVAAGSFGGVARGGELLYFVDDGQVVFTNTPSRPDAKPVPGLEERVRAARANLPATAYDSFIERVSRENGIDPSLVKAVALVESAMDPEAVSPKGARGLMQLMPATADLYGVSDPHDPYQSLRAGARHLRDLLDEFGGNLTLALAAYNAGAGAVRRHGGVPAYRETRDYVSKVHTKLGRDARRPPASREAGSRSQPLAVQVRSDGSVVISN
jgi:soluble lytic murein transglycosylase-like protein